MDSKITTRRYAQPSALALQANTVGRAFARRDAKTLAASLAFFDSNAAGIDIEDNFISNPAQGDAGLVIKELGFGLNAAMLHFTESEADAADALAVAVAFMNNLKSASAEVYVGQKGNCEAYEIVKVADFARFEYDLHIVGGADVAISIHEGGLVTLPNPVVVLPNQRVEVRVDLANADGIAGATAPGTKGDALKLECHVAGVELPEAHIMRYEQEARAVRSGAVKVQNGQLVAASGAALATVKSV